MAELRAAATELDANLSELRAPFGPFSLESALRGRAAELESLTEKTRVEVAGQLPELPSFVAAHAFYIVSEAMTNAVRHSGAQAISVHLSYRKGVLQASVSDDGSGISTAPNPPGHGVRSMVERAELLGGTLTISGTPGQDRGTTVRLLVPLSRLEVTA
jgi:signal transduction histidine kinase